MPKYPPGKSPTSLSRAQQVADAEFLTREFGMMPGEASKLVAREGVEPEELKDSITEADGEPILPDPLADGPMPSGPPTELTKDVDKQARKPVVHTRYNARGP